MNYNMGISVECYRQRIGCFKNSFKTSKVENVNRKSSKKRNFGFLFKCLLLFAVVNSLATVKSQYTSSSLPRTSTTISTLLIRKTLNYTQSGSCQVIDHNFIAKITNGNRRSNGIKICQWNAGGGFLSSKQPELHNIVAGYRPHVPGVTESSFKKIHEKEDVEIQDYNLFFSSTLNNPNLAISRACVYVHKDLKVKVRDDLMNDKFSSVWLELGKPRQKKLLVCIVYREWQYVNQLGLVRY